jgi:class 3 adenylate cyclase/tetratricopeptide (TPR) repeat protein
MKCPSCQTDNPDSQNFCGNCGIRLGSALSGQPTASTSYTPAHLAERILTSRSALEGERKLVTVLFCDIAESTQLAHRVGADAMHALLNRFFDVALSEVHRVEGTINQFLGDGFMALFGAPLAHEDHARRALLAALAIRQRLCDSEETGLSEVRVRMGVNTGMVVVGRIGDHLRMDYTAVGDTTHLAARLQQSAQPDTIRLSPATQHAASAWFEFHTLGRHALKGIAEPMELFELVKARTAPEAGIASVGGGISSPLVGRESELAVLTASLSSLQQGRGGIVFLTGEPGVGKSRLLAEARRSPQAGGVRWLEGRSLSFGRSLSYWPFIEILKQVFAIEETDAEAQAWSKLERGCTELFAERADEIAPYLGTVLALEIPAAHAQRVKYLDPQGLGRQVFLTMRQLFERLAARGPVLVLMEDWHWVDHSSVALCEHLLPLTGTNALSLWFAARPEPKEPMAQMRTSASEGEKPLPTQEIALTPLAATQSGRLLDNLVGADRLPETLRRQILRKTEGNPFFIEEITRALIADGALVQEPHGRAWRLSKPVETLSLPDSVQGVIVARIDRLEEGVKEALKLASVIGRSFFLRILQAISDAGQALDSNLQHLQQAELIRLRQKLPELEYIFKHALVQEAAYGSIVAERRKAIHRAVARAIETLFPERLEEFTSMLAYHYARAEDWEKAQEYLFKAGDQAGRMAADAEALEHYKQAEAAYTKASAIPLTLLQRATLDRKLGQAMYGIGDYSGAVEQLSRALSHLGVRYPATIWGVRRSSMRYTGAHFLELFLRRLGLGARFNMPLDIAQEISSICRSLVWLHYFADEERMGLDILIELHAGDRSGDTLARAHGLANLGVVFILLHAHRQARKYITESIALAREGRHSTAIADGVFFLGWLEWTVGSLDAAERCFEEAALAYKNAGEIRGWGGATIYWFAAAWQRGRYSFASGLATQLLDAGEAAGDPHVYNWGLNASAWNSFSLRGLDEAAAYASKACEAAAKLTSPRIEVLMQGFLSKCRIQQGRISEAWAAADRALRLVTKHNLRGLQCADAFNAIARLRLIELERSSSVVRPRALKAARRAGRRAIRCASGAITWMAEALRLTGTLAWLHGDKALAGNRWRESVAFAERFDLPVDRGCTLLEMGKRLGDDALLSKATEVFAQASAKTYLAAALHARAALALESGAETSSLIEQYDRAIVALDEAGAEYDLGVACGQRAQILRQLGYSDRADADLETARRCFQAVRADQELDDLA